MLQNRRETTTTW